MTAEEIAARMTEAQRCALRCMQSYAETDTPCRNARHLAAEMGGQYDAAIAKFIARELVKLGLAVCERGLVTSDGDFYGSGWCLTPLGQQVRAILESNHDRA